METSAQHGSFVKSCLISFYIVFVLWLVKYVEEKYNVSFADWGIYPREWSGLRGIFTAPLIHGDLNHLISNSVPLFVLGIMLWYFFPTIAIKVFTFIYPLTDIGVWLAARHEHHIGASGIVYGLVSFLFFSGIFRRDRRLMALSLLVVFLYGSLVWGVFPIIPDVSWESHFIGGLTGILCAFIFRKQGPQRIVLSIEEEEEDDPDDENPYWKETSEEDSLKINYVYVEKNKE